MLLPVEVTLVDGGCETVTERIARETALTLRIDGEYYGTAMILAGQEREFAAGFLFSQGVIDEAADIADITVHGTAVDVRLHHRRADAALRPVTTAMVVHRDDIFTCVRAVLQSGVFAETEAVHSAGLFREGREETAVADDLGRHVALDKVIGTGLLAGADFSQTLVASTGRQPVEMITKCVQAGIPVIATKGVPTTLAIEMAERYGITVCGLVRGSTMYVYTHPERIQ